VKFEDVKDKKGFADFCEKYQRDGNMDDMLHAWEMGMVEAEFIVDGIACAFDECGEPVRDEKGRLVKADEVELFGKTWYSPNW
jgi:hypothetical protein